MVKARLFAASVCCCIFVLSSSVSALAAKKENFGSNKPASPEEAALQARYAKENARAKEIEGSEWDVTLTTYDPKSKERISEKDTLVFKNRTVSFKSLEKKGFSPMGYTVTANEQGDGGQWENFLILADGSIAMTGKWEKDAMSGGVTIITGKDKDKKVQNYSFTSVLAKPDESKPSEAASETSGASKQEPVEKESDALVSKEKTN